MVDMDWKAKISAEMPKSPKPSEKSQRCILSPTHTGDLLSASPSATLAYEQYLRLPELWKLWSRKEFSEWKNETLLRPALQALEITFRFVSIVLSDPRRYANRCEWKRRLESLAVHQIALIGHICEQENEDDARGTAPIVDLTKSDGVLARDGSLREVWKIPGASPVVNRTSEASLLPRLATWQKSESVALKIAFAIECHMQRSPFTLGLGEPNLAEKPNLEYDLVCKPSELHSLKKSPFDHKNLENQTLFTAHQILECWIFAARELLKRIGERIDGNEYENAGRDCWLLERIWKLASEIEDLHLLLDPDDFLRLKNQLAIGASSSESEAFCFRSKSLLDLTKSSKDLRHKVPAILGVEVDPQGGPRVQVAAMELYHKKIDAGKIHLLQALQAIEAAVKRFFFSYRELIVVVMGSLEAKVSGAVLSTDSSCDPLLHMSLEPPYFPSLDAAKTFLGDFWHYEMEISNPNGARRRN